jgi:hypothetical protein
MTLDFFTSIGPENIYLAELNGEEFLVGEGLFFLIKFPIPSPNL